MGGWKKEGEENLTNDTPPKKGFGPPSYGTFSTPVGCRYSVFPVQNSTTEQTRSSFGGVQNFSGGHVLWYVFLPPCVLHPPISWPKKRTRMTKMVGVTHAKTRFAKNTVFPTVIKTS